MQELSELQAIDFALGKWISEAFTGIDPAKGPKQFRDFLSRPINQQIYRSEHGTPAEFLKSLEGGGNPVNLPVIFYSRTPGLTNGEDRYLTDPVKRWDAEKLNSVDFAFLPVTMTYQVFLVAWDKPTLDKLILCMYDHKQRNYSFSHSCIIGDIQIDNIYARLTDHKVLQFDDMSEPVEDRRLWAVQTEMIVNTQVITGSTIAVADPVTLTLKWVGYSCADTARFEPNPE